jgi:hypothetical protein
MEVVLVSRTYNRGDLKPGAWVSSVGRVNEASQAAVGATKAVDPVVVTGDRGVVAVDLEAGVEAVAEDVEAVAGER